MPFDELPLEIIQYIFCLCCRRVTFTIPPRPPYRIRSGTAQVTLSLVCSRWRAIALNTRTLWGDVLVCYEAGRELAQGPTASFQSVQNWLSRAGMAPISLSSYVYGAALESQIAAISQTLLPSFHITNLDLESVECDHLLIPTNNSYYLERLYLTVDNVMEEEPNVAFPRLPEMPSLKELHLCLDPGHFVDLTNIYLIPWHQLRVFSLSGCLWSSQMLFNILQRCTSLVGCTLWAGLQSGQHTNDIVLPNLESLVLSFDREETADVIIRSLTVPNLRSLDIRAWRRSTGLPLSPDAIVIMARRSGFNKRLTNFSLSMKEQPVDVRLLLGSMLALNSIQLFGPLMFQPGTFDDLSSGTIGPQLEKIYFGIISDEEIGLLLEAVGQRHEKAKTVSDIRPFVSVTYSISGGNFESHMQRARQCGDAFDAHVEIHMTRAVSQDAPMMDLGESDPDFSMGSTSDEESYLDEESYTDGELGSVTITSVVLVPDEEPLQESNSDEESHSLGEPDSQESCSFEDPSSESHWKSDPDIGLDSHSGEESDAGDDVQSDA